MLLRPGSELCRENENPSFCNKAGRGLGSMNMQVALPPLPQQALRVATLEDTFS
jgi:hypothetical protein